MHPTNQYDIIVVGAGVAGCSVAFSLARKKRRVLLIERDMKQPNRMVGELLALDGTKILKELGLEDSLKAIQAVPIASVKIIHKEKQVAIPVQETQTPLAWGFHYGNWVQELRRQCQQHTNITCLEATVVDTIDSEEKVVGVECRQRKNEDEVFLTRHFAHFTIIADGCFSKFRKRYQESPVQSNSSLIGLVLKECTPPAGSMYRVIADPGPILLFPISCNETRFIVDIPGNPPSSQNGDLKEFMHQVIYPQLPEWAKQPFLDALLTQRLRTLPNQVVHPGKINTKGILLLGDAWSMRHSFTGAGMADTLKDAYSLAESLDHKDLKHTDIVLKHVQYFQWKRTWLRLNSSMNSLTFLELLKRYPDGDSKEIFQQYYVHLLENRWTRRFMAQSISGYHQLPIAQLAILTLVSFMILVMIAWESKSMKCFLSRLRQWEMLVKWLFLSLAMPLLSQDLGLSSEYIPKAILY